MKTTSPLYKSDMRQFLRGNSRVLISFGNIDTTAVGDASAESSTVSSVSHLESLFRADRSKKYASLELNRWLLDGSYETNSGSISGQAYVSKAITNEHGVFSTPPRIVLTLKNPHILPGITFNFETAPSEINISYTDSAGDTYAMEGTFTGNTFVVERVLTDCIRIEAEIVSMPLPYTAVRITSVMFGLGRVYDDSVILNVKQTNDVDPLSRWLPKEKLTFSIIDFAKDYNPDNPNGVYTAIDIASPVEISYGLDLTDGNTEWLKPDKYILTAKPTVDNNKATFTATGYTGTLTQEYYKGRYYTNGRTLYNLAIDVLTDAGITEYDIDESLKGIKTYNPLPVDTVGNLLQMIAHAGMCCLYTTDDNVITIRHFVPDFQEVAEDYEFVSGTGISGVLMPFAIDLMDVIDNSSIKQNSMKVDKLPQLRNVIVKSYQHTFEKVIEPEEPWEEPEPAEKAEIFKSEFNIDGEEEVRIDFSDMSQDIEYEIKNGRMISHKDYASVAILKLANKNADPVEVIVKGYTRSVNEQTITRKVNSRGSEDDEEQNELVSTDSHAKKLAKHIADYLTYRNTYTFEYRGNPEFETGDYVFIQTPFTWKMSSLILTDEINYNGAIHGKLTVKGGVRN